MRIGSRFLVPVLACIALAGCGGLALKEARPFEAREPFKSFAEGRDERIAASIEEVIVPNGPSAWACDAQWDQYLIRLRSFSGEAVQIREIAIFDALDQRIEPRTDRGALVDGTREIARRHEQSGEPVRAPGVNLSILGGLGLIGVAALAPNARLGLWGAGPMLAISGVLALANAGARSLVNRVELDNEIERRQTSLPVRLARGEQASVNLFFPVTPKSGRAEVVYFDGRDEHRLHIDTRQVRKEVDEYAPSILRRRDPEFPDVARRAGISEGYVKASLAVDSQGRVQRVDVLEARPQHVFNNEARRTFQGWIYSGARSDCRIVEATLEFKR